MQRRIRYRLIDPLDMQRLDDTGGEADGVVVEADGAARRFVRGAPEFHDDPQGARLFAGFSDGPVVYPPCFTLSLHDSLLAGYRMSLTRQGLAVTDEALPVERQAGYTRRLGEADPFANEETGLARLSGRMFRLERREAVRLAGSVAVLCSQEPYNFGSFLFRVLPKLAMLDGFEGKVLARAATDTERGFLALAGLDPCRLIRHEPGTLYAIDHAIRPGLRNPQGFLDPVSLGLLERLRARFGRPADPGLRVYVSRLGHSRRGGSTRVMRNEAALAARLERLGFAIVEPERLDAAGQIGLFSAASMVVGPSGAGMFNAMFCRPGTRVIDIESEPHWIHAHSCLFASAGLRYGVFEALCDPADRRPVHRDFEVDIEALCARIAVFGPERAAGAVPVRRGGTLDQVSATHARGWARDPAAGRPVSVEICVDGRHAGQVLADQKRQDLAHLGDCAFVFAFDTPVAAGVPVTARFADTGSELVHSPRRAG